ncbi:MAG: 50S ribosomal protein L4 [Clostridia bacterium]|nr:50S ribosomal protein L4 [Clostridia bacterium]
MPNVNVVDMTGKKVGTIELSDKVFGAEVNPAVLHTAVRAYLMNQRQGTQSTLTRTEVSGGGKKPWKQKGTGHARQGSTRAPQWTHGGIALGPKPREYRVTLNRKVRRSALFGALSQKVAGEEFIVVNAIAAEEYKTKTMTEMLKAVGAEGKTLVVLDSNEQKTVKSFANIPGVKTAQYNALNVYDVLNCEKVVIAEGAVKKIEEVYA